MSSGATLGDRFRRSSRRTIDVGWVGPLIGSIGGLGLAVLLQYIGPAASASVSSATVQDSREGIWSGLALLFTGLSVVLAVVTLTAQHTSNQFSPRILRIKMMALSERMVLIAFSFAATYIITELFLQRSEASDELARPLSMLVGLALLVSSAVILVIHISRTLQFIRIDRTLNWIGGLIIGAGRQVARQYRDFAAAPISAFEPQTGAVEVVATSSGYVWNVQGGRLCRLASDYDVVITIDVLPGQLVTVGDRLGWVTGNEGAVEQSTALDSIAHSIELAWAKNSRKDIGHDVRLLVDIAIRALSPGVNDPHTASQSVEQLVLQLRPLAESHPGPRGWASDGGPPVVLVRMPTLGELVDYAARRVLLYGAGDSIVTDALLRLAEELDRVGLTEGDQQVARDLMQEIVEQQKRCSSSGLRGDIR